jgi:hypothetical protein
MITMAMEFGVLGATICSLLSEFRNPHLSASDKGSAHKRHRREIAANSVSLALSSFTFGMTILGAGSFFTGVRIAGTRIRMASRVVSRMHIDMRAGSRSSLSTRNCISEDGSSQSGSAIEGIAIEGECTLRQNEERESSSARSSAMGSAQGSSARHGKAQ